MSQPCLTKTAIAAALVLGLAACASEPRREGRRDHGGPPAREAAMRRGLFISPSGEPFRGADGFARWFAQADADHDRALTAAEFQADAERFFRRLDVDGDGVIDGFEMQAYEQTIAPEVASLAIEGGFGVRDDGGEQRGGMGGGRRRGRIGGDGGGFLGRGRGPERQGAARYSLINEPEPVTNADANLDGRVTLQEWRAATDRRFKSLDKAKTGRLTLDGLRGKRPTQPAR